MIAITDTDPAMTPSNRHDPSSSRRTMMLSELDTVVMYCMFREPFAAAELLFLTVTAATVSVLTDEAVPEAPAVFADTVSAWFDDPDGSGTAPPGGIPSPGPPPLLSLPK